ETKPPRDFNIDEEVDEEAFRSVYTLLRRWAEKARLNPKPSMPPGIIARDADNFRGILAVADDCGGDWPQRTRKALMALFEQQKAEDPTILILRHGIIVCETLEVDRIGTIQLNKELRKLDLPDWDWNRYRGLGGSDPPHPLTISEQAELFKGEDGFPGIVSQRMRHQPKGKQFRGVELGWLYAAVHKYEAMHEHEPSPAEPHLRLVSHKSE